MKNQSFTFLFLLLFAAQTLFAQDCPPPGFPDPGNTCPLAPILCPDLDGYCSTINNNNTQMPFPCCTNSWTLNNDEWFGFFAGSTTITIQITPQNCSNDGGMMGLQGAIYDACPFGSNPPNGAWCAANLMDIQCNCTENPFILTATDYVVGEVYWIVLDGCAGNVCDYTVDVLEGSTVGFAPPNPSEIIGQNVVCQGVSADYTVEVASAATIYDWTLDPADAGTLDNQGETLTINWSPNFSGTAELCVSTANLCYTSTSASCLTIQVVPDATQSEDITFCPGDSIVLNGQVYNQSATVMDTIVNADGCDTIITYNLTLLTNPTRSESISLCPGESVTIGGQVYAQSGTVLDTLVSLSGGCDTIVTYTISLSIYQTSSTSISFCPGESVTIGGQVYNQSGTVIDTLSALQGCDTIVTYTLTQLPSPTSTNTIAFCPGETITLGGVNYTQPGTVTLTLPANNNGCDTIATYILQYLTPAPSTVSIVCPNSITVNQASSGNTVVNYDAAIASSDCPCPGIELALTSGLVSGSSFPQGQTSICYAAQDSCGQSASCCFTVSVLEEDDPCDTKINGCIKYELLTITEDVEENRTYRIRVTNNCPNKLLYTAIQVPDGMVAIEPATFSIYTAPSGNTYRVRSPNFSPMYSVRFSSISDSINLGESDIFKYTLPAQADVTFINIVSRLVNYVYLEAHLNTFYCPIGITPVDDRPGGDRTVEPAFVGRMDAALQLFPNPANQQVYVETPGQAGELSLHDATGRVVLRQQVAGPETVFSVEGLPVGIYQVVFVGEKAIQHCPLVVQH
jgi:hypothetical protein